MKNKILLIVIFSFSMLVLATPVFAQNPNITDSRCQSFYNQFNIKTQPTVNGQTQNVGNLVDGLPVDCTATGAILHVINLGLLVAGGVAVAFLMLGGFLYMTSAGNEEQSEKGRKILTNTVIGLVVIILSTLIVRVIAGTLTNGSSSSSTNSSSSASPSNPPGNTQQPQTPGTGNAGSPLGGISSADITNYKANGYDYLGPVSQWSVTSGGASGGISGTLAVNASDHNSLTELAALCGNSGSLPIDISVGGNYIGSGAFQTSGSAMTANVSFSGVKAGDIINATVCGQLAEVYTVPSGIRN